MNGGRAGVLPVIVEAGVGMTITEGEDGVGPSNSCDCQRE